MSSKKQAIFISSLIILWYSSNIGVLLLNKFLLSNYGFRFPIFLTMCHMAACAILSYFSIVFLKIVPLQTIKSKSQFVKIATLSVVFCGSVVGGNVSLRYLAVSFNQAVGATTPFFTALFAYLATLKREAWVTYAALVPVVAGVVIASGGEPSFHFFGFVMCISATAEQSPSSSDRFPFSLSLPRISLGFFVQCSSFLRTREEAGKNRRVMAKCHRNDVGSVVLDRPNTTSSGHFWLWSSFSGASFRRKIFDAVSCGRSSRYRHRDDDEEAAPISPPTPPATGVTTIRSITTKTTTTQSQTNVKEAEKAVKPKVKSEKLSDLLNLAEFSEAENYAATKKKVEALEELKRVAKDLQADDDSAKRKEAASKVRLLAKEDSEARATLAMLGVIPPLVALLDSDDAVSQIASLYALLNLGIGNDVNKAAILQAGAVHNMLKLIESPNPPDPSVSEAIIANFLGLSALDSNKPIIGASGAIPFLVRTLKNSDNASSCQAKQDALRALYNLSIFPSNISFILETDLIPFFLNSLGDMEVSERILAILSNVVSVPEGRKAISSVKDAFPILVDALNWNDSPGCQEKASYILMVMAHKAFRDRQAMIEAGMVSALLELTLLGSTLAQKRASRILECLRVDKGKQVSQSFSGRSMGAAVSAPICGSSSSSSNPNVGSKECMEDEEDTMSEEKKAVKQLIQQSLQDNMRRIVKRANLPQDFVPSDHFKSLTSSSTSKSLPF